LGMIPKPYTTQFNIQGGQAASSPDSGELIR
jgi:hypothetical protein